MPRKEAAQGGRKQAEPKRASTGGGNAAAETVEEGNKSYLDDFLASERLTCCTA